MNAYKPGGCVKPHSTPKMPIAIDPMHPSMPEIGSIVDPSKILTDDGLGTPDLIPQPWFRSQTKGANDLRKRDEQ